MQAVRSNITRVKSAVESKIPTGNDLFGFPGISKVDILGILDECYAFSHKLNDLEPHIEITILKRKISPIIELIKNSILELRDDEKGKKEFDKFLSNLTKLRDEIRLTYIFVIDKGIRSEEYILSIAESSEIISSNYIKLKNTFEELNIACTDSAKKYEKIKLESIEVERLEKSVTDQAKEVTSASSQIKATHEIVKKYEKAISDLNATAGSKSSEFKALHENAVALDSENKANKIKIDDLSLELTKQIKLNSDFLEKINKTLAAANRIGMAGAFLERKTELKTSLIIWTIIFIFAIAGLFIVGIIFLAPILSDPNSIINLTGIIIKLAIASPLIWLAWMSARQYGFIARIREDYSFKYACAMSFDGFKKHAVDIDKELERQLLDTSIITISQNPIRLYGMKDNHASPIHELIAKIIPNKKSMEDDTK